MTALASFMSDKARFRLDVNSCIVSRSLLFRPVSLYGFLTLIGILLVWEFLKQIVATVVHQLFEVV